MKVSVIDLFAGPGGLGEGFAGFSPEDGEEHPFVLEVSAEKDTNAHKTLELRAFFREFPDKKPEKYYQYLRGEIDRETLFDSYPEERARAREQTMGGPLELGSPDDDKRLFEKLEELRSQRKKTLGC